MGIATKASGWRARIAVLGAVCGAAMVVAGCGEVEQPAPPRLTPAEEQAAKGPVFAYRTDAELAVVHGAETVRAPGSFGHSSAAVTFTEDGQYAFAVETSSKTLVALGVRDRSVTRIPCDCTNAVGLRGSVIGWWREPGEIMSMDLAGSEPAAPEREIVLPDSPSPLGGGSWNGAELVAATDEFVLLARVESRGLWWEKSHLYAIGADAILPLGRVPGIDAGLSAAAGPDGHTFVLAGATARSATCGSGNVATIDVATNGVRSLPTLPGECSAVYSPRWSEDGSITIATRKWADLVGAPSMVDRLQSAAQGWAPVGEYPVVDMLRRVPGSVIEVVAGEPTDARGTPHGVLVVHRGGVREELAKQVISLGAPPTANG
ncbi:MULTISPECIES: hypothetical protein [Nocardia]|uniref:hypothetical protein n=1 Tax=Nocardia TaxID=1817 RepID=UPI0006FFCFC4|nr:MULTISPECIES: hypothetical protein [Nocardia]KQY38856.1 hypothetical protein ASD42_11040 [Nocardia sp. Root136]